MVKGVITGDIVDSSLIPNEWKSTIISVLENVISDFNPSASSKLEMFRGDSFQIVVGDKSMALTIAIAIRAALRARTPDQEDLWDARISVGVGEVSFESDSILTSDGEAFRLSGREFDALGKRRLSVLTSSENINDELKVTTSFADEFITRWTARQAEVVYAKLHSDLPQKELARSLGMTVPNFSKHWNLGHGALMLTYIERYKKLINHYYCQ